MIGIELSLTLRSRALKSYEEMTLKDTENVEITYFDESDWSTSETEVDEANNDDQDAVSFLLKNIQENQEIEEKFIIPVSVISTEQPSLTVQVTGTKTRANTRSSKKQSQTEIEPEESYSLRKFACNACDKRFLKRSNLIDHLRIHANLKSYKCDFCSKSFIQFGNLKAHLRSHTKEKPYK